MKTIRYFCAVIALLILTATAAAAADNVEYDLNRALGLLPIEEYNAETAVTRQELAYIAAKVSGTDTQNYSNAGEVFYNDVPATHDYAEYINAMARLDIVRGFSDGWYEPEYTATYTDAAYAFVTVLGYRQQAESNGGYPMGYIRKASELGLFKNTDRGLYISQSDMNIIIYNVLTSKRNTASYENGYLVYEDDTENTILYEVFDVTEVEGLLSANSVSSVDSAASVIEGSVKIDGEIYEAIEEAQKYLGYNVLAFVQWDGIHGTVIAIGAEDTEVVKIWDEDIDESTTASTITAYVDSKKKSFDIDEDAEYLYNGAYTQNLKREDLLMGSGYIELINNDDDKAYDILSVTYYEFVFVSGISASTETIMDKYGNSIKLENKKYKIYLNGEEAALSDLAQFDSVSYTRSKDDDNYYIWATRNEEFSGAITGSGDEDSVIIDAGAEYKISPYYSELVEQGKTIALSVGLEATYYTDIRGRIFAFEMLAAAGSSEQYAVLIKLIGNYEEDGVKAKVLKSDGTITLLPVSKKVRIDGVMYKEDDSFITNLSGGDGGWVRRVIKYLTNGDEEISEIDTPIMGENEIEGIDLTQDFIPEQDIDLLTWVNASSGILNGRFYVSNNTIVFTIPSDAYRDDDTMYSVSGGSVFANAGSYGGVNGYDLDDKFIARAAIKVTGSAGGSVPRGARSFMVAGIKTVFDTASEEVLPALIMMDGSEVLVSKAELIKGVEKGDIVRYNLDAKNRVDALTIALDVSQEKIPTSVSGSESSSAFVYRGEVRYGTHYLIEANPESFIAAQLPSDPNADPATATDMMIFERDGVKYPVQISGSKSSLYVYRYSGAVYIYDRATGEITESDMTALTDALYKNNPNARIYVHQGYGTVNRVFVIK